MLSRFLVKRRVATEIKLPTIDASALLKKIENRIDSAIEYPGSKKDEYGGGGVWYLQDWLMSKIDKNMKSTNGKER